MYIVAKLYLVAALACAFFTTLSPLEHGVPVCAETECFIRSILKKLDTNNVVTAIEQLTDNEIEEGDSENIITYSYHNGTYIFHVDEQWFNNLYNHEKTWLIGHEAMHIILGHLEIYLDPNNPDDMHLSREQELEADLCASLRLACAHGGIDTLRNDQLRCDNENDPLATHPSNRQRIACMKPIANIQKNKR